MSGLATTAAWLSAALGTAEVALLARLCLGAYRKGSLHRYRSPGESVADLLDYAALVEDGVVLLKSGGLLAAFIYRAPDAGSSTDHEQNALAEAVNRALQPLGAGWMVHVDAIRQPVAAYGKRCRFPDPVTQAIDDERRCFFESRGAAYEGYCVLSVTYLPPMAAGARFRALLFDDEGHPASDSSRLGERHLTLFRRELQALQQRLPFEVERLGARPVLSEHGPVVEERLLRYLHYCISGLSHPIALPRNGAYLDLCIGGQDIEFVGEEIKVGGHYLQVVGIDGFPLATCPGLLNHLAELPCEYRWSTRAIFLDPHEGVRELEKYRRKWRLKVRGFVDQMLGTYQGPVDQSACARHGGGCGDGDRGCEQR